MNFHSVSNTTTLCGLICSTVATLPAHWELTYICIFMVKQLLFFLLLFSLPYSPRMAFPLDGISPGRLSPWMSFPLDGFPPGWHFPRMAFPPGRPFPGWPSPRMAFPPDSLPPGWHFPWMAFPLGGLDKELETHNDNSLHRPSSTFKCNQPTQLYHTLSNM